MSGPRAILAEEVIALELADDIRDPQQAPYWGWWAVLTVAGWVLVCSLYLTIRILIA